MRICIFTSLFVIVAGTGCATATSVGGVGGGESTSTAASGTTTSTSSTTTGVSSSSGTGAGPDCLVKAPAGLPVCVEAAECSANEQCATDAYCDDFYPGGGGCTDKDGCGWGQCYAKGDEGAPCQVDYQCLTACGLACNTATGQCAVADQNAYDSCPH